MHRTARPGPRRNLALALTILAIPGLLALAAPTAEGGHGPKHRCGRGAAASAPARHDAGCDCRDHRAPRAMAPAWHAARWHKPAPVIIWKHHRFVWHGGCGFYVNVPTWAFDVMGGLPAGCAYIDPLCHRSFASVDAYQAHLRHRRHAPLLEVSILVD